MLLYQQEKLLQMPRGETRGDSSLFSQCDLASLLTPRNAPLLPLSRPTKYDAGVCSTMYGCEVRTVL